MRHGFSLVESVLVLAVLGIVSGIALPHLSGALDSIEVDAAANHLITAHQRARIMAITRSQVLVLTVEDSCLAIRLRGQDNPLWSEEGPSARRVTLMGPAREFIFSPEGITLGLSNATLQLIRGAAHRRVIVSRLGRIRIVR
jgi:prepilin-type N-terminal cleavage/methylation domain-containing protein